MTPFINILISIVAAMAPLVVYYIGYQNGKSAERKQRKGLIEARVREENMRCVQVATGIKQLGDRIVGEEGRLWKRAIENVISNIRYREKMEESYDKKGL